MSDTGYIYIVVIFVILFINMMGLSVFSIVSFRNFRNMLIQNGRLVVAAIPVITLSNQPPNYHYPTFPQQTVIHNENYSFQPSPIYQEVNPPPYYANQPPPTQTPMPSDNKAASS